jgi:pimeloyl-ACP methyl ester carboxylesterase
MGRIGRAVAVAGIGVAAAGVAAVVARGRADRGSVGVPDIGVFTNGMAYGRVGTGSRTVLSIPGGPGNQAPTAGWMRSSAGWYRPFTDAGYSVWNVTRKRGMPVGHSMADIADDYAELIDSEFGGRVDVVVGTSYGGMVAFQLAARHPEKFATVAVVAAAVRLTEEGAAADRAFASHVSGGRLGEAVATLAPFVAPGVPAPMARVLGAIVGPMMFRGTHEQFASDVAVEAEAEATADATDVLPTISVPVLLIAGDEDRYFPLETIEETARLIPGCTLLVREGAGHMRVAADPQGARDILSFVGDHLTHSLA